MENLTITKENAKKAYDEGCSDVKKVLQNLFGSKTFIPEDITDRIKTIEDACKELGVKTYGDAYRVLKLDDRKMFADTPISQCDDSMLNAMIFCRALNEGWWPDWDNSNEAKWYPYFDMRKSCASGFGFGASHTDYWDTYADVGSRLCFKNEKLSTYAGKTITSTYRKFMKAV